MEKVFATPKRPFIILVLTGIVLYFQTLFFDFSYLDDNILIIANAPFLANFSNFMESFKIDVFNSVRGMMSYYRPVLTLSFMFDYQFGGVYPFIYHFTNIVLHIISAGLLFIFLKKLGYIKELAFLFSVIFVSHPVLTQAVAWIPGRNDSLLAVFILATFVLFIRYIEGRNVRDFVWSIVFFTLALFTKESAIVVLPLMFFYMYLVRPELKMLVKKLWWFIWPVGIVIIWYFLRQTALGGGGSNFVISDMIKSMYIHFPAVPQFIGKIFFPFNLSVLPIIKDTVFWYGFGAIAFIIALIFYTKTRRWSYIIFGLFWFFAFLLPSFIRPDPSQITDFIQHRLYVPIIGIFILLLETNLFKRIDFKKKSTVVTIAIVVVIFSILTVVHSRDFSNRMSFWKNAADNSPHYPLARRNFGAMLYLDGNMEEAEYEFRQALLLNPNEPMAHNNIGLVYMEQEKFIEAEEEFRKELEINPYYDDAHFNLGILYYRQEKYEEAKANFMRALEINPRHSGALQNIYIINNQEEI